MSWDDEDTIFNVVINHEEQYSIWPEYKEIPKGWTAVGKKANKQDCLTYINEVWTDMRPLSLRKHMAERELGTTSESHLRQSEVSQVVPTGAGSRVETN